METHQQSDINISSPTFLFSSIFKIKQNIVMDFLFIYLFDRYTHFRSQIFQKNTFIKNVPLYHQKSMKLCIELNHGQQVLFQLANILPEGDAVIAIFVQFSLVCCQKVFFYFFFLSMASRFSLNFEIFFKKGML